MFPEDEHILAEKLEVHDRYQFEVKLKYPSVPELEEIGYQLEAYFFFPENININAHTYQPADFYNEVHNYVRFKTPEMGLYEILAPSNSKSPLQILSGIIANVLKQTPAEFQTSVEYEAKMLACIIRAALRDSLRLISQKKEKGAGLEVKEAVQFAHRSIQAGAEIILKFREMGETLVSPTIPSSLRSAFRLVDEFLSLELEYFGLQLVRLFSSDPGNKQTQAAIPQLLDAAKSLIVKETDYRIARGFQSVISKEGENEAYVFRKGILKRYIFTNLFLTIENKDTTTGLKSLLFGIAAGIAMAFATAITIFATVHLAQISWAFFFVMVVTYMFKDRIKDGFRDLFARILNVKLYDQNIAIIDPVHGEKIGICQQKATFVPEDKVPPEVIKLRRHGCTDMIAEESLKEPILYFKNAITLYPEEIYNGHDRFSAVTHIFRYNMRKILINMDEPVVKIDYLDPATQEVKLLDAAKTYHVNVIARVPSTNEVFQLIKLRVILDRNGIKRVEWMDEANSTWKKDLNPLK